MYRKILCCIVCLVILTITVARATVRENLVTIAIKPVSYQAITDAARENKIEELLYPSGLSLPTKYSSLMLFAGNNFKTMVVPLQVQQMLYQNWATSDLTYTFAEVEAARLYYYTYCWQQLSTTQQSVLTAINEMTVKTGWFYDNKTSNAKIQDSTLLLPLLEKYKDVLQALELEEGNPLNTTNYWEMISENNEYGFPLSHDYSINWLYEMQLDSESANALTLQKYYSTRSDFFSLLGIEFEPVSKSFIEISDLLSYNSLSEKVITDGYLSYKDLLLFSGDLPVEFTLDEDSTSSENTYLDESLGNSDTEETDEQLNTNYCEEQNDKQQCDKYFNDFIPNKAISEFDNKLTDNEVTEKSLGFKDIFTTISVVIVCVSAITVSVVDFIKSINDPTRKWKRW